MANYADSSQKLHGCFTVDLLTELRSLDYVHLTKDEYRAVQIYLYDQVKVLAAKLNLRQQAIATSMVFLLRFYTRAAYIETNVHMIIAAAVYLACKIEECPQHIKVVTQEIQTIWGLGKVSTDTQKLAEAEFYLINELDTYLVVYHPYRILASFKDAWKGSMRDLDFAWMIINDSYNTDIPLLFEPDTIAYTSIYLSVVRNRHYSATSRSATVAPLADVWTTITRRRRVDMARLSDCAAQFLAYWRFRDARDKIDGAEALRRAKEEADRREVHEKQAKSRVYRDKILAMSKR